MIKENTESLFDVSDTLTQIKTNKVISILTIFTVILGILTLMSGMFGMNVILPFEDRPWAFMWIFLSMSVVASLTVLFFKRKKRF